MPKKQIAIFFIFISLSGCYKYNKPEKPDRLIPKDKMVNILIDLKLIAAVTGRDKKILDSAKVTPKPYIYKKYNIDSIQFDESNTYYTYYIDEYVDIYTKVKDSLSSLKAQYDNILKEEERLKKEKDSFLKIKKELKNVKKSINTIQIDELPDRKLIAPVVDKD